MQNIVFDFSYLFYGFIAWLVHYITWLPFYSKVRWVLHDADKIEFSEENVFVLDLWRKLPPNKRTLANFYGIFGHFLVPIILISATAYFVFLFVGDIQ